MPKSTYSGEANMFLSLTLILQSFMNEACHTRGRQGWSSHSIAKGETLNPNSPSRVTGENFVSDVTRIWL